MPSRITPAQLAANREANPGWCADFGYRVRHPAAPDLFVWVAGTAQGDGIFATPLKRYLGAVGEVASLTIQFSQTHPGMTKERADELAAFVGGTVEEVGLPRPVGRFVCSKCGYRCERACATDWHSDVGQCDTDAHWCDVEAPLLVARRVIIDVCPDCGDSRFSIGGDASAGSPLVKVCERCRRERPL